MESENEIMVKKNKTAWLIGGILIVILLAGAVFVGGSLLNKKVGISPGVYGIDFTEAEEIPQSEPEVTGVVTAIGGDTLTVQELNMNQTLGMSGEGGVYVDPVTIVENAEDTEGPIVVDFFGAEGPITEIVTNRDTIIYKDVTPTGYVQVSSEDTPPELPEKIQMKVEPGTLDEIGPGSMVTIWGERRGDRIIASFILYQPPIQRPVMDYNSNP